MVASYLPSYQDATNYPPPPPVKRNKNRFRNRASGNRSKNQYRQSGSGNQPVYSKPPFVQVPAYHSASFSSLHPIYLPLFRDQFQKRNSKPRRHNQRRPHHQSTRRNQQSRKQNQPRKNQPRHNQPRRHHPRRLPK